MSLKNCLHKGSLYLSKRTWTALSLIIFSHPLEASCVADLSSIQENFCIGSDNIGQDSKPPKSPLRFSWNIESKDYALKANTCFYKPNLSLEQDVVIFIDRGQTEALSDSLNGSTNSSTTLLIESVLKKLQTSNARVALLAFSSDDQCSEFSSSVVDTGTFPCVYLPFEKASNQNHQERMGRLIKALDKKYSANGLERGTDLTIMKKSLLNGIFGVELSSSVKVMLISDGMFFSEDDVDSFSYLNSESYHDEKLRLLKEFDDPATEKYEFSVAVLGTNTNAFDSTFSSVYENGFCASNPMPSDCSAKGLIPAVPNSWPVNNLNQTDFLKDLLTQSNSNNLITSIDFAEVDALSSDFINFFFSAKERVVSAMLLNSKSSFKGKTNGNSFEIGGIPRENDKDLTLKLKIGPAEETISIPIFIEHNPSLTSNSQEMICTSSGNRKKEKKPFPCGVVGDRPSTPIFFFLFIFPIFIVILGKKKTRISQK